LNKQNIIELLLYQKEKALNTKGIFRRRAAAGAAAFGRQKEIHVLTGIRRCGKSTLLRLIIKALLEKEKVSPANILYCNFEDERLEAFESRDFQTLHEAFRQIEKPEGKLYFFLDEIQNVPGWQKWLSRLYEFENVKIFVTGSNATMLSGEIASALTGRSRHLRLFPLSFREFLDARNVSLAENDFLRPEVRVGINRQFADYVASGGFPEAVKTGDRSILQDYFRDIVYRDIVARYRLRNIRQLKELALFLATNIGCRLSLNKLRTALGFKSLESIRNYIGYFEETYLFHQVPLFDYSVKKQVYNPKKLYCIDHGMAAEVGFNFSTDSGWHLENMVCIELLRRGLDVYYWKDSRGREVDFIIRHPRGLLEAVQVCWQLESEVTFQREIEALVSAAKRFNLKKATLVTADTWDREDAGGVLIDIVPAWKWLLEDNREGKHHVHPSV